MPKPQTPPDPSRPLDGFGPRPLPRRRTKARPGTRDKALALRRRAARGESLWRPDDGTVDLR